MGYVRAVINGVPFTGQGSSFSAPLVTSLFALLNDELVTAGLAPLPGNLGPTLYQPAVSAAFTDVTTGTRALAHAAAARSCMRRQQPRGELRRGLPSRRCVLLLE